MIETQISILINRKSDLELIKDCVIKSKIQSPIYICEYEENFTLNFTSEYEEWELDSKILNCFLEYEFTENLEKGRKEIRLQISRNQSDFGSYGWVENPTNETKYLVKKSKDRLQKFNPRIAVLFEDREQNYFINIVNGINKGSGEKGFLLLNEFKNQVVDSEVLKDKLYKTRIEAFHFGVSKMESLVDNDFQEYLKEKKKTKRKRERIPRKTVRNFINSCNKKDLEGILKDLDESVVFEKNIKWKTECEFNGIEEFKKYIKSENEDLCNLEFKIRSSWTINLPSSITIGIKYFPDLTKKDNRTLVYRQYSFEFKDGKIIRIIEEK